MRIRGDKDEIQLVNAGQYLYFVIAPFKLNNGSECIQGKRTESVTLLIQ